MFTWSKCNNVIISQCFVWKWLIVHTSTLGWNGLPWCRKISHIHTQHCEIILHYTMSDERCSRALHVQQYNRSPDQKVWRHSAMSYSMFHKNGTCAFLVLVPVSPQPRKNIETKFWPKFKRISGFAVPVCRYHNLREWGAALQNMSKIFLDFNNFLSWNFILFWNFAFSSTAHRFLGRCCQIGPIGKWNMGECAWSTKSLIFANNFFQKYPFCVGSNYSQTLGVLSFCHCTVARALKHWFIWLCYTGPINN